MFEMALGLLAHFARCSQGVIAVLTAPANATPPPVKHRFVGFINPHCATCGRTPMQAQRQPSAPCERMTLPFDRADAINQTPRAAHA
jgi:hypothetical protein